MTDERPPIHDYIIIGLPPGTDPNDPATVQRCDEVSYEQVTMQYARKGSRPPRMIEMGETVWVFTSDPDEVARVQPGDGCPTCLAGNDQAIAALRDNPELVVALGNMTYTEHW